MGARLIQHLSRDVESIQQKIVAVQGVAAALLELLGDPSSPTDPKAKKDAGKAAAKGKGAKEEPAPEETAKAANPDVEECNRAASMAIVSLSATLASHQTLFGTNGSVPALVSLAAQKDCKVRSAAVKALQTLGQHESNQGPIVDQGVLPSLVDMMYTHDRWCMEKAAECVSVSQPLALVFPAGPADASPPACCFRPRSSGPLRKGGTRPTRGASPRPRPSCPSRTLYVGRHP